MKRIILLLLILSSVLFFAAEASMIKLKTGQTIEGDIVEEGGEYIKINFQGPE